MYEALKNFNKQFSYEPEIENKEFLVKKQAFVVVGMGGSALAPKLLQIWNPELAIHIHNDYGLPPLPPEEFNNKLLILSSYSGNTEETLSAFKEAKDKGLNMAVIATGGELLTLAIENNIPYIKLPNTGIQPRGALGFSIKAFLKIVGAEDELKRIGKLTETLNPPASEAEGKKLAETLKNHVPVIYSSNRNFPIAYNWKIKLNETGKIPAFCNSLPELNHNEMTGFDVQNTTYELSNKFFFILLKDKDDDVRITKRMEVLEKLLKDKGLKTETIEITGDDVWYKIFSSLMLADWVSYNTAILYNLEPEKVPLVEEFKKLIS